ncbi:DUF2059 domain-containing protein [Ruegeria halocynthiae]|uniref:DUF2059 domain-containing protein n=1 Tax=Ruegeria halocynthiae TaxID=985054 RepID=UPI00055CE348|nr:DUF2059 domain-containing protein [Ruegeria halocynthiae]
MRLTAALLIVVCWVGPSMAADKIDRLMSAMHLRQVVDTLRQEGQVQGKELDETLLGNAGGALFQAQVDEIFEPLWMHDLITETIAQNLTDSELDRAIMFFESDLGQTLVSLENSARQAISDETIRDMAQERYLESRRDTPHFKLVDEYIQVNDLIELNVQNSLSADFNFFRGLGNDTNLDEGELLAQLLSEKDSVRDEAEIWLYSFLLLAYHPLSDAQMRENIAFSRTEAGQAVNQALFESFDSMYDQMYFKLGQAVSGVLSGSDL